MFTTDNAFSAAMQRISGFEEKPHVAIALSGGCDSMALLLLAQQWVKERGGKVTALTVDHGLRPESAREAAQVAAWCKALGIPHHILAWKTSKPTSAIQAQAREARYRLLGEWCRRHHVLHLLTAHHRDDQAETLLFRLARGSQLDGLAAIAAQSDQRGVRLLRPLLALPKQALQALLMKKGQQWIEDPSNQLPLYTRNMIREHATALDISAQAGQLAERLGTLRSFMEQRTAEHMAKTVEIFPGGYGTLLEKTFKALEEEYALRILSSLVQCLSGEAYPPRQEKLKRLLKELQAGKVSRKRTFAGCVLEYKPKQHRFLVVREPAAMEKKMTLKAGESRLWDNRFLVSYSGTLDALSVGPLGVKGRKLLEELDKPFIPPSFPTFWHLEELVAVPHIPYKNPEFPGIDCKARFRPAKPLAGAAFFSLNSPMRLKGAV